VVVDFDSQSLTPDGAWLWPDDPNRS